MFLGRRQPSNRFVVSRLYIGTKSYLVVAVQNAAVLLPPAYLVRIPGYRLSWANQSGGEIFHLKDGCGESVTVHDHDDLLCLNKNSFCRVAKDMFNAAQNRTGTDWSSIWQALTGERVEDLEINAVESIEPTTQVDFVELFNPGNFKAQKGTLTAGQTHDVKVNPALDLTRTTVQEQTRCFHQCRILTKSINRDLPGNKNTRKVATCYSLHHNVIGIKLREGCSFCMSTSNSIVMEHGVHCRSCSTSGCVYSSQ